MRPKRDRAQETKAAEAVLAAWLASLAEGKAPAAAEGGTLEVPLERKEP